MFQRLGIEPREGRVFIWSAAALVLAGWADVSVKNVSETFFLKRVGVDYLPLAYLINSVLLVATTYVAGLVAARSDRPRLLPRVFFSLALTLIPLWYLVRAEVISSFVLLVLASKQFQSIALLAHWQAMGDLLHGRQAKRLFPAMAAGYTLGTIIGSFASGPIGNLLGIDALLPVAAAGFAMSGLLTLPLRKLVPPRLERSSGVRAVGARSTEASRNSEIGFMELWRDSRLFRLLVVGSVASGLLGPMLYFQFQYVVDLAADGEQGLLSLLAFLRGWTNVGVLLTQLLITSALFRRIGIPLSIVLSPAFYLFGFLGMSVRLNLAAGVSAFAGTKLQDSAVYDPAMQILFNLFPERERARATGLLEGPVKRAGGALGNLLSMAAVQFASAIAVGYIAIPIAIAWLGASVALWRTYPALLLRASVGRRGHGDDLNVAELIDANTLRVLAGHLVGSDPRPAIGLVSEAPPPIAVRTLAAAARAAPSETRHVLVSALARQLERSDVDPVRDRAAAIDLEAMLVAPELLSESDRAVVVQAFGRLTPKDDPAAARVLEDALADASPGVQLAARAALSRRSAASTAAADIDVALESGVSSDDAIERRIAREELRACLLAGELGPRWRAQLGLLVRLLDREGDRSDAAEAVTEVAVRHGVAAAVVSESMLAHRGDLDLRVRSAMLRFCGFTGQAEYAAWLIEHLAGVGGWQVQGAAREGLIALGPAAADVLLVELSFGRRRARDAIVPIIRQLKIEERTLRSLFDRELESARRKLVQTHSLGQLPEASMVRQRLRERTEESLHTALLLLAAIHDEDRIAKLGDLLKRGGTGANSAILYEALDALLNPHEKSQLMPLMSDRSLELRARSAAAALGIQVPTADATKAALLEDNDDLTRRLAEATLAAEKTAAHSTLAGQPRIEDDGSVLSPVEIALHLKSLPLFDGLTTRQLIDLADEVREVVHPPESVVVREGDTDDCLYLIVEGTVRVTTGDTQLAEMGVKSFFGEIAVLEGERRTATVTTLERVRLLRLDRDDLLRLMEELPAIAICICQTLSKKVRELTERVRPEES